MSFFKFFIVDVYVHLAFRSFMVYFCLLVDVVFLCPAFFLLLFLFFFPHSASQLLLFQKIVSYLLVMFNTFLQFFHLFIYLCVATDPREPKYQL